MGYTMPDGSCGRRLGSELPQLGLFEGDNENSEALT